MKRILITGASGLIGSELVLQLCSSDKTYQIFAASSDPRRIRLNDMSLTTIHNSEIENVLHNNKIDVLIQLAFPRNVADDKWADGIRYSLEILFLARKYQVARVINVSSQSIYGLQRMVAADESHSIVLTTPYTTGKYCTEIVAEQLFLPGTFTNIRLSTTISPFTKERVPNKLFSQITDGKNLVIKSGKQQFSFLDVRDAANGIICMIENECTQWKPIYNLGTAEVNSLLDIAQMCLDIAAQNGYKDSKLRIVEDNVMMVNQIDVSLFRTDFSWCAKYSLRESMEHIFNKNYGVKQ